MAIQKPYQISITGKVIDGSVSNNISWKNSGDVSASFSISISNNATGALVWSLTRTYSFAMNYTIPANAITNGVEYKITVTVWNDSGQSATSQPVVFTASATPVVTIPTISTVGNHSYLFTANYSQAQNQPVSSFVVNLYSYNKSLIKTSGTKTGVLEHRFDLMKNNERYFVEFIVTSANSLSASSGLVEFTVVYDNPPMYFELEAETIPDKASVKLNWSIKQVVGRTTIAPVYLNGTELDVRNGSVIFDEGFEVSSDFTLKIWFRSLKSNVDLINLTGSNGNLRVQYKTSDSSFHIYKTVNNYPYHYSYKFTSSISGNVFLCLQQKSGKIDILAQIF